MRTPDRRRAMLRIGTGAACLLVASTLVLASQESASAASTVSVNAGTTFQTVDGFGVSEAFSQANSIRSLSATAQRQALDLLFSPTTGAGFTILRSLIPSDSGSIEPNAPAGPTAPPA